MNLTIRDAGIADCASIVGLIDEMAAGAEGSSPVSEAYAARYLSAPTSKVLVAELDGHVVGLLSYSIRPDLYHAANACLIEELVVHEPVRSRGVGSALLVEVLSRAALAGCAEVSVAAVHDNRDAIRLYQRHGFDEESVLLEMHLG